LRAVCLLYALSGFVSLGYQVVWFRIYVDRFGSTNLTFGLVLCCFIAGLGTGSLASDRCTRWLGRILGISDRLRIYGVVEILVSGLVLLVLAARLLPVDVLGTFPYEARDGIYQPSLAYFSLQIAVTTLCVFAPCFAMGITFPLLCRVFSRDARFPSLLYAWNTLGACLGVVVCQLVFLPVIGHDRTLFWLIGANVLLGAFFLLRGGAGKEPLPGAIFPGEKETAPVAGGFPSSSSFLALVTCAILSGFLAGALEGDMFKRIVFVAPNSSAVLSFISFWAILAIFLASALVRALPRLELRHIKIAFALVFVVYAVTWRFVYPLISWMARIGAPDLAQVSPERRLLLQESVIDFPTSLLQLLLFVGIFVFPSYLLVSLLLPWVCNRLQAARRHLGLVYGLNTVAFCLGVMMFTWVAPRVSIFYSMKLMIVFLGVGALVLAFVSETRGLPLRIPIGATVVLGVAALLLPRGFDAADVIPGSPAALYPVRALASNAAHTTYVVEDPLGDRLYFDNYSMSATDRASSTYMRLMAHFPLLCQESPRRALLICFGVGNTASAIASHQGMTAIDVVDLNDKVITTAPEFSRVNREVYKDPRLRFIHDDGRNFLRLTDERYDLITSEPPPPMHIGVYRLYSREYYQQVRDHLTASGMMTQWLPTFQMPREAVELAVSTFLDVFPHTLLFSGNRLNFILVGSPAPLDVTRIERRFDAEPAAIRDLRAHGVRRPLDLLARIVQTDGELRRRYGGRGLISDQSNALEHLFTRPLEAPVIAYDPLSVLAGIDLDRLECGTELREVATHLGRLQSRADLPASTLLTVRETAGARVALSWVDWAGVDAAQKASSRARKRGDRVQAIALLEQLLSRVEELPQALRDLARLELDEGRAPAAVRTLERLVSLENNDGEARTSLGFALLLTGHPGRARKELQRAVELEPDEAQPWHLLGMADLDPSQRDERRACSSLQRAAELDPDWADPRNELAWVLATSPDPDILRPDRAVELAERAVELTSGENAGMLDTLGAALAASGRFAEAVEAAGRALLRAREEDRPGLIREIEDRLALYREKRTWVREE